MSDIYRIRISETEGPADMRHGERTMATRANFRIKAEQNGAGHDVYAVSDRQTGRLLIVGFDTYGDALRWVRARIAEARP